MYIQEIVLDGFKSYQYRQAITGWDSQFNAITGESNILDAICFVLGITNLSAVRAQNLQDLVYKRGQAGVTKASVTIEFNNEDADRSPFGYHQCKTISVTRQIVIGGRNKWLVNGHAATQQTIQNLFQSVQLNVNNPHFLIMQGRITKVLNMKPPEILAMIEEAAGTRMYEEKKRKALETIEKKDKKLEEITRILDEEIIPKLDHYREEKKKFLEYQSITKQLEYTRGLVVAYEYSKIEEKLSRSDADLKEKESKLEELANLAKEMKRAVADMEKKADEIEKKKRKDGGKFEELDNAVKEFSKQLVKIKTQFDLKQTSVSEEEAARDQMAANVAEIQQGILTARDKLTSMAASFEREKTEFEKKSQTLREKEDLLQTLTTGMAATEGRENGFMDQLQAAKAAAASHGSTIEQLKVKIKACERELKDLEPKARKAEKESAGSLQEQEALAKKLKDVETKLASAGFDPEKEVAALQRKSAKADEVAKLRTQVDRIQGDLARYEFSYSNPEPNFDRRQVKGLVAELVSLPPNNAQYSTALEIAAGGRLFNVVVDTEVVGSKLLSNGKLKRKVTIIPLNKIQAFVANAEKINAAKKIAPGGVDLALNLIGYDDEVTKAMEYVFGGTLVCKDAETAKKVTFNQAVRLRSITIDGDEYNPTGTLSGGSKPSSAGVIINFQALREQQAALAALNADLAKINEELADVQKSGKAVKDLTAQKELLQHELKLVQERIGKSANAQLLQSIADLRTQIEQNTQAIEDNKAKRTEVQEQIKSIEKEMAEFEDHKEEKLKSIKAEIASLKKDVGKGTASFKEKQAAIQLLKAEIDAEQMESELGKANEQLASASASIEEYKKEVHKLAQQMAGVKKDLDAAQAELDKERKALAKFDTELQQLEAEKKRCEVQRSDAELESQKLAHDLQHFKEEKETARKRQKELEKQFEWIQGQKQLFGKPNTPYDFESKNIAEERKKLKQLEDKHDSLRKKTDMKVMETVDRYEKKETSLKQMLSTVRKDKRKIQETIVELDKHKLAALETTWKQVNGDFGGIFGDLLPGNTAKLEPPENQDITEGLEVKVNLGGVWKQSLTELSGGQRSLIALSLILALLRYKPAPMYILDEVDAALDLSHTQNIGQMLRTRFSGSQFIVVSLKEGMFNNANVLFRAKFVNGVSTVE
ncbi:condensin subunit, partial [Hyaloraphidium curvatum]